ncbi:glycerate kinase [Jatrophihabitans telluris]|uniref:Glycerate kinase n=1 Tax=Jatrophihabitans telluris TaxID=2038343 RepID=A0ABY4R054_9ACTN|nr:glycerate kinase [Jatrophihabitans telluris]UQX89153.1 glycerate kinase [Jatrophihabitans telluris]
MIVLAAPDKFRGTATAEQVCAAIAAAVLASGGQIRSRPMADGGEGLLEAFGGANRWSTVTGPDGPDGAAVLAGWRQDDAGLAVIEAAQANGLILAGGIEHNDPMAATSRGVGELLVTALRAGAERVLLGVGGSATTDGGYPAVAAVRAAGVLRAGRLPVPVSVCCDVATPFLDAARVYGPQKGAGPEQITALTGRLAALRDDYEREYGVDVGALAGAGAAGGLAGGLAALGARLVPGFATVASEVNFDGLLAGADLVVTGEGAFDRTSLAGKVVGEVILRARSAGVPVLVVAGVVRDADWPDSSELTVVDLSERFGRDRAWTDTTACVREAVAEYLSPVRGFSA